MVNKIYLIKNLTPWMMDELLAFSNHTKFVVILIRKPESFYKESLQKLKNNQIKIIIQPFSYDYNFKKIFFVISFFFKHLNKFLMGYSAIIGWKSIIWFLRLDFAIFQTPLSIHSQFATQAAILSLMLKNYFKENIEYSFTFHAHDIYFKNKWFPALVKNSQNAFSISNFNIRYVKEKYKNLNYNKLKLSRLGVFSSKKIDIQSKNKGDQIVIGFLSWFDEKKGIHYLLEAIRTISQEYRNKFKFIFAGDGPLRTQITSFLKENKLEESVKYVGTVNAEAKENFFLSLDLFILPSIIIKNDMDGIPVVLMEAISFGIPIISTNISGIPEICINNYNGILIEEKSTTQIVNAIVDICTKNKLFTMRENALKIYEKYNLFNNTRHKIESLNW